ncbi:MAG: SpoIIIAH-like family protein [Clostridia bacterium]|nr:SpoIIIAH-like family protein [Clostridia bacterium]
MEQNELTTKVKGVAKRLNTKHLVVICAILLIGCAVVLNWILYSDEPVDTGKDLAINLKDVDFSDTLSKEAQEASGTKEDYFAAASLDRQKARDEALEVLKAVAESESALPEAVEAALNDISAIADAIACEANIESLVKAKGFEDCIAVISDTGASVIVKCETLTASEIAQIKEIVYEQAGVLPANLTIVQKT